MESTSLTFAPPGTAAERIQRHLPCDAVEPGYQLFRLTNPGRLLGKHQPGGLEGVFRLVAVAEHAAADAQDHGTMPGNQGGEGAFVVTADESTKKGSVGFRLGD